MSRYGTSLLHTTILSFIACYKNVKKRNNYGTYTHWAITLKPPVIWCRSFLCHQNSSDLSRLVEHGLPKTSGTKTLAVDPLSPLSCELEPPWIWLVCQAHPTDARSDCDSGILGQVLEDTAIREYSYHKGVKLTRTSYLKIDADQSSIQMNART